MKKHVAPVFAALLLLLPMLYVGSYLALAEPGNYASLSRSDKHGTREYYKGYRSFGRCESVAPALFWPLEQIDRKVRPGAWNDGPRL